MIRIAAILLCLPCLGVAQDSPAHIAKRASGQLEAAANALAAADGAKDRVTALNRTVQAYDEGLSALRASLREAAAQEYTLRLVFEAKQQELSRLLGVLTSMERSPAPLLLLHPSGPVGTARSGMILSQITPALQAEAQAVRTALEEVEALRVLQQNAAQTLAEGRGQAQEARRMLSKAMADRTDLPTRFDENPERLRNLLQTADTLDSFAAGLGTLARGGAENVAFAERIGSLPLPVAGVVLRSFDEADAAGVRRPGLLLATDAARLVTSPAAATIRYVGPLLDYGLVVILEPADDVLMVLAGLGEVFGQAGEVVTEGAPLGLMPDLPEDNASARKEVSGSDRSETLYIELRMGQNPEDPAKWFAETKDG